MEASDGKEVLSATWDDFYGKSRDDGLCNLLVCFFIKASDAMKRDVFSASGAQS